MITGTARDADAGITVEVAPGGSLQDLTFDQRSLRLSGERLAEAVLRLVESATARADQRVRHEFGLGEAELTALGIGGDTELAEHTTPDTWRV
ncbi:YbaB/EbfC family DNA-binding protein [Amycolatopsis magusensis]|uniref:YbaB/EbfC family DNA-binding protein n=1 Tax=Amycolatopsis magusensis TaxID=882444 RepID=UPI003C2D5E7B